MKVANCKSSARVYGRDCPNFLEDSGVFAIGESGHSAKLDVARDGVEENVALYKKKSMHRTTRWQCSRMGGGKITASNAGMCGAVPIRVVLPLRVSTSGP